MSYARSFTDLEVYKRSRALRREVFSLSKRFPKDEAWSLTSQWRRASRSIGAQIAEAWAKRRYTKHFISKLSDADGENLETQHWTIVAYDDGYITRDEAQHFGRLSKEVGKMLGEMMNNADTFCGGDFTSILREDPEDVLDFLNTEN
ncbi:MAG: four helix bundle protein [Prosthecobacter sp.]|nr:four helix bundle protein [Prosthecobacter sp.]